MRMSGMRSDLLAELEQDGWLDEPARLRQRSEALDRLDRHFPPDHVGESADETELWRRAQVIRNRLDAVNHELYRDIRHAIRQGSGSIQMYPWLSASARGDQTDDRSDGDNYDYRDELLSGILQLDQPDDATIEVAPETVFYQPTPARVIFDLIDRVKLAADDVLVDLGSGLGHVPLLAAICTGASGVGIELEWAYVDCARKSARSLNLDQVAFIQQDARVADFSRGTVFYLYTPFTGTILRAVLDALRREAASRMIRVCAFGPCMPIVAAEPWLEAVESPDAHRAAIFRSR